MLSFPALARVSTDVIDLARGRVASGSHQVLQGPGVLDAARGPGFFRGLLGGTRFGHMC